MQKKSKFLGRHHLLQIHRPTRAKTLIGGGDDAHRLDGIGHVVAEVDVLMDRFEEIFLFAAAETVVIGFVVEAYHFIAVYEISVRIEWGVVEFERLGLGVRIDIGAIALRGGFVGDDAHAAFRTDDVFDEKGDLAHHRSPTRFIPADRAILKGDLQMPVVDFSGREYVGESCADARHANRLRARHLANDIDVVNAAINDRRNRRHQIFVRIPVGAVGLLVEVHAHHQWLAESLCHFDELDPAREMTQDIANH